MSIRAIITGAFMFGLMASTGMSQNPREVVTGYVGDIKYLGENWGGVNANGFCFWLQSNPSDVCYFIVKPDDDALQTMTMAITSAKLTNHQIVVDYLRTVADAGCGGKWESLVYSIQMK